MPWASWATPAPERLWLPLPCNARQVSARTEGSVPKWSHPAPKWTPCPGTATRSPPLKPGKAGNLREPGSAPLEGRGSVSIALPCPPLSPHAGVGEEAGSQRQWVVGEDGVVRGAGAGGVLAGGRVLLEGHGKVQVLQGETVPSAPVPPAPPPTRPPPLTSSETAARILSSPSTSCLKVGRCEGTACQHSRISMYLGGGGTGVLAVSRHGPCPPRLAGTHDWAVLTARGCSWTAGPCGVPPSAA